MFSFLCKMNAFDPSLMEEPDYQVRLDGYKEALEMIQNMSETSWNEHFIRIVIFNCLFTIRMVRSIFFFSICRILERLWNVCVTEN